MHAGADPMVRAATAEDAAAIARIWHQGWRDGHLGNVPETLAAMRTESSFGIRAGERVRDATVAEIGGAVAGFVMIVGDEVEQVYVDRAARGSGVAGVLLDEAERQVRAGGHASAWLAVVPGNARARAFYPRRGWRDEGSFEDLVHAAGGPLAVPAHRYVKDL